ncbi:MAG: iron-sulfur cluster assembly scaffold protein, partial [Planctomycetota bacterium]
MVDQRLRDVLLRAEGIGEFEGPGTASGSAEHPVCGDRVVLSVLVANAVLRAVRWRATGCPASMAIAALAAKVLVDVPVPEAADALRAAISAHGGLAAHERHAEGMAQRALAAALDGI